MVHKLTSVSFGQMAVVHSLSECADGSQTSNHSLTAPAEVVEILNASSCAYWEAEPIFSPSVGLLGLPLIIGSASIYLPFLFVFSVQLDVEKAELKQIADQILSLRGVNLGRFVITTTGKDLK